MEKIKIIKKTIFTFLKLISSIQKEKGFKLTIRLYWKGFFSCKKSSHNIKYWED